MWSAQLTQQLAINFVFAMSGARGEYRGVGRAREGLVGLAGHMADKVCGAGREVV